MRNPWYAAYLIKNAGLPVIPLELYANKPVKQLVSHIQRPALPLELPAAKTTKRRVGTAKSRVTTPQVSGLATSDLSEALIARALTGALVGAGTGAVTGAVTSDSGERLSGAVRGGLSGGLTGGVLGTGGSLLDRHRMLKGYTDRETFAPLMAASGGALGGYMARKQAPVPKSDDKKG